MCPFIIQDDSEIIRCIVQGESPKYGFPWNLALKKRVETRGHCDLTVASFQSKTKLSSMSQFLPNKAQDPSCTIRKGNENCNPEYSIFTTASP